MCGRYTLATPEGELVEAFDLPALTFDYFARYNISPGQPAPVVAEDSEGRRAGLMEWGFVPAWKDEPKGAFINARAESVATKRSFREAFARRRCLIPADGFYEWQRTSGGQKTPYWFRPAVGGPISFAGIWETWRGQGVEPRHTFAILTTDANADVLGIHDRMPVVIAAADRAVWLDRASDLARAGTLLQPAPSGSFESHAVSSRVNRTTEDAPELIEPVG